MWENAPSLLWNERIAHAVRISISVSINNIAIPQSFIADVYSDGRKASWITEKCVEAFSTFSSLGGYEATMKYDDTEVYKDAIMILRTKIETFLFPLSVRSLTNSGVKFQLNQFIGGSRTCSQEDLIYSLGCYPYFVVVDITEYGEWRGFILESRHLLIEAKAGRLTPSGWNKSKLEMFLLSLGYRLKLKNAA